MCCDSRCRGSSPPNDEQGAAPGGTAVTVHVVEARAAQVAGESVGLSAGQAVGCVAACAGWGEAFRDQDAPGWGQGAVGVEQARGQVVPVVHGAERPQDGGTGVGQRQRLGAASDERDAAGASQGRDPLAEAQHDRGRVDAGGSGGAAAGSPGRSSSDSARPVRPRARSPIRTAPLAHRASVQQCRRDDQRHVDRRKVAGQPGR
jgi:hypothetical protein